MKDAAIKASANAYCPYSDFRVGASVLTSNGEIISGCNVENASFGLSICAERNAIFQAIALGHRKIVSVVIFTPTPEFTQPCGACRQVISEFGNTIDIFAFCKANGYQMHSLNELLPNSFGFSAKGLI